ncbi:hypothetical protein BaRGS_00034840 [Batillaria attramentaria]|uniref:Uncharacterized protein n=1 Tax=Batillaria attramentaria TaxID=370345 RepID=A0ABD0JGG5_9CAEN
MSFLLAQKRSRQNRCTFTPQTVSTEKVTRRHRSIYYSRVSGFIAYRSCCSETTALTSSDSLPNIIEYLSTSTRTPIHRCPRSPYTEGFTLVPPGKPRWEIKRPANEALGNRTRGPLANPQYML